MVIVGMLSVSPAAAVSQEEAMAIGVDAYIYGYPLVTMEMTRKVMTNVEKPEGTRAPMGQFVRMREYPTAAFRDVTAPNADTLYNVAWIDVSKEPWVFSVPDMKERYFLMPMLDGWTDVFQVPGKRTTGTKAKTYAITGPNWQGKLPSGLREYKSPTGLVWILGRIYCTGTPDDYKAVHALQDKFSLVPLSAYGKPYTPSPGKVDPAVDMKTPVREQVNRMDAGAYFKLLAQLMKDNPPAKDDAPMLAKMAQIGIVPGQDFDIAKLDPAVAQGLQSVPKAGVEKIMAHFKNAGSDVNGWLFSTKTGVYGTDYLQRAFITAIGLGANRPQDAIYPTSEMAVTGKPYDGANKYVIHFPKGQTAAGQWLLVPDDVRCGLFLRAKPAEPLHAQFTQQVQDQQGRLRGPFHPQRLAGQRQGIELAAGAGRQIHPDAEVLLAQGRHPRRHLEAAGGDGHSPYAGLKQAQALAGFRRMPTSAFTLVLR